MTASNPGTRARCEDCDHVYRVPDPDRTYRCKACGGTVRAVLADESEEPVPDLELDAAGRMEANEELRQGYGWMTAVTWLFRLGALAYACVTVLDILALANSEVPVGVGSAMVALSTLLTALMLVGAMQSVFKPFVWTLVVASLAAVVALAHLVGPHPLGVAFYWSAICAVLFGLAAVPTLRSRHLIAQHLDLYILHHASRRTRHTVEGRSAEEQHERLLRIMRDAVRRAWKLSAVGAGTVALASLLGSYTVYAKLRPQELSVAVAAFEKAWNASDLTAVDALFSEQVRERQAVRLASLVEGHGWADAWPRLADGRAREQADHVVVDYELDGLTIETSWVVGGRRWSLAAIELPVPPLAPVLERFQEAWRASDSQALSEFFSDRYQQRMLESIESSVRRRRWDPFPAILATDVHDGEEGVTIMTLKVPSGDVTTKWIFRSDGKWGLKGLQFPKP